MAISPADVERRRRELNLTQRELSKLSGVNHIEISRIENGRRSPRYITLAKLEKVLMQAPEFVTFTDCKTTKQITCLVYESKRIEFPDGRVYTVKETNMGRIVLCGHRK